MKASNSSKRKKMKAGYLLIGFFSLLIMACGGSKSMNQASTGDIPDWYTKPPKDAENMYGVFTAVSQDMQLSSDKAQTGANQEIAKQIELNIQGVQQKFEEEVGTGEKAELLQQFTQATRQIVSQTLIGIEVKEKKTVKDGDLWRTYVLEAYPIGEANKALLDKLKSIQTKKTQIRSAQAFQDLDSAVAKYDAKKK